jgi:signal transduction histidine kinase
MGSRIARELHDDFNQRVVILAMDLERVEPTGTRIEVRIPLPDSDRR